LLSLAKSNRSRAAKKAAQTRIRNKAAADATNTKNESENFCAELIAKKKGGRSVLHGLPDFINFKNGKGTFYEVKPYLVFNPKKHADWNVAAPDDRMLSEAQLKSFWQLIELKQKVFIIYYNKETTKNKKPKYTIHKDAGGKSNPRLVTEKMLKTLKSSDPHMKYFNGHIKK